MGTVSELPRQTSLAALVAANIRAISAWKGWKQTDLARALGVANPTVQRKWVGGRDWGLDELDRVALVLGVPVERLFARSEGLEPPTFWLVDAAPVVDIFTRQAVA